MTTLGALIDIPVSDPFLDRVKKIISDTLPSGWRDWPLSAAVPTTCSNVVDRNKLRFALPTLEVVNAFINGPFRDGEPIISERAYKSMEAALFAWPVGQALLLSPAEFAKALRPTSDAYDKFIEDTKFLRPMILSRDGVNKVLSRLQPRQTYDKEAAAGDASSLVSAPPHESLPPVRPAVLQAVRKEMQPMNDRLTRFESCLHDVSKKITQLLEDRNSSKNSPEVDGEVHFVSEFRSHVQESPGVSWDSGDESPGCESEPDFDPYTVVRAPDVPEAPTHLVDQLMKCQKLDKPEWNRVPYAEAEAALKHGPPFQPLVGNFALPIYNSKEGDISLRRSERTLANISYGLLAQREAFQTSRKKFLEMFPNVKAKFKELFTSEDAEFRKYSDLLLQFTCGKRADVISERRNLVIPSDPASRRALAAVPPSSTHLFNEEGLSKCSLPPAHWLNPHRTVRMKRHYDSALTSAPPAKKANVARLDPRLTVNPPPRRINTDHPNGTFVDRCQPVCFNAITGSNTNQASLTDMPSQIPYTVWRRRRQQAAAPVVNIGELLQGGDGRCVLMNVAYIDALLNPYLSYDPKWGLEPWGLNLSSPDDELDVPLFGRVHEAHCTFFKERFQRAEPNYLTPTAIRPYYMSNDNECGMNTFEKYAGFAAGNWLVRACRSRPTQKDLEVVDSKGEQKIPAAIEHRPTKPYLESAAAWKSYVNAAKRKMKLDISDAELFTVDQRTNRNVHWYQVYWTNKASVVALFDGAATNRSIPLYIDTVKYEYEETFGGVVVSSPSIRPPPPPHNNSNGPKIKRRQKRANLSGKYDDETTDSIQLQIANVMSEVTHTVHDKVEKIKEFAQYVKENPKGVVENIGEGLAALMLSPDMYTQQMLDLLLRNLISTSKEVLSKYLEQLLFDTLRQCAAIGLHRLSSELLVNATSIAVVNVAVVHIAATAAKSAITALSVGTLVLTISQLMDLFWTFIADPYGFTKPSDGDPVYRMMADLQARSQQSLYGGHRDMTWTPSMFLRFVKQGDDKFVTQVSTAQIFAFVLAAHNITVNSDGAEVVYTRNLNAKAIIMSRDGSSLVTDPTTTFSAIPNAFVEAIRSSRARQLIVSPNDVLVYELDIVNRALHGLNAERTYNFALILCVVCGIFIGIGTTIVIFTLVSIACQTLIFFILWGNIQESDWAQKIAKM
ncbi:hypothetical protein WDU94_012445 [Cyamophila willieti]